MNVHVHVPTHVQQMNMDMGLNMNMNMNMKNQNELEHADIWNKKIFDIGYQIPLKLGSSDVGIDFNVGITYSPKWV